MKKMRFILSILFLVHFSGLILQAQERKIPVNLAASKIVSVIYSYNFNSCTIGNSSGSGFTAFNLTGDSVWKCNSAGFGGTRGVQMNGYSIPLGGAVLNEDWLISPVMDISSATIPLLQFRSRTRFNGLSLKLMVSTNYIGSGNPAAAVWTEINGRFPDLSTDVWTLSDSINLTAFKSTTTSLAWVYYSNPADGASRWTIDDVSVYNSTTAPLASILLPFNQSKLINFGIVTNGQTSVAKTILFSALNISGNLTITCPASFELSKNNSTFSSSIQFTNAELIGLKTIYLRFKPTVADAGFGGDLRFTASNLDVSLVDISGSSLPKNKSLDVVNWNLAWFGSLSNGPADENLQLSNAVKVMDSLDADIYILQEIVDSAQLGALARSLQNGPYDYIVSLYGSLASSNTSGNWPSAQKLAYVYRRSVFSAITTRGFTSNSSNPNNNFNWASGRFPFLMNANVTIDGITKRITFLNLHAKAESGVSSDYNRRLGAANLLVDSLNTFFPNAHVIIAGDYNDDLDETISTSAGTTVTPYTAIMNQPLNFSPLSFWNSRRNESSYIGFENVIDHSVVSNEMNLDYHAFSCVLRTEAVTWVNSYVDSLTEHIPLATRFNLRQSVGNVVTGVSAVNLPSNYIVLLKNPSPSPWIQFKKAIGTEVTIQLMDCNGKILWLKKMLRVANAQIETVPLEHLPGGLYFLIIQSKEGRFTAKIIR